MTKFLNTDPESFRGKLYLLAIDKLVIGAILAAAFVAYSFWTKEETRRYEGRLRELDLAFRRAEYLRELVPIVTDDKQDPVVRAQLLAALIHTQSVDDKTALTLSERIVRAGLIRADYPDLLRWQGHHFLLDALLERMPSAMQALLDHYPVHAATVLDREAPISRNQADATLFWEQLFHQTVSRHDDSELSILDDTDFLLRYLFIMDRLYNPSLQVGEGSSWFDRKPRGLRILAAVHMIWGSGDRRDAAAQYLLSLVEPVEWTPSNLRLAGQVIDLLEDKSWASKELASRCVEIVFRDDRADSVPDYRYPAANSYVVWYAKGERPPELGGESEGEGVRGWEDLEPLIVPRLRNYMSRVEYETTAAGDLQLSRGLGQRLILETMIVGVQRSGRTSDATTRQLLSEIFSLDDRKLEALHIRDLKARWLHAAAASRAIDTPR